MKVLMISTDIKALDPQSDVAERFISYGNIIDELRIFVFSKNTKKKKIDLSAKVSVFPTNSKSKINYVWDAYRRASSFLLDQESLNDWIITTQDPFETGIVGRLLKKRFEIPLEIQVHTDIFSFQFHKGGFLNVFRKFLAPRNLRVADGIRVVSKRIKNSLIEKLKIKKSKINILPIFAKTLSNNGVFEKPNFAPIFLVVSRLTKEKNVSFAIEAFEKIKDQYTQAGLIIAGEGPLRKDLERLVKQKSLDKDVLFVGFTKDLGVLYDLADILLHPSFYEGYGLVFQEAKQFNLPFVSFDVGIASEICPQCVCKKNDLDLFVKKILEILQKPEKIKLNPSSLYTNFEEYVGLMKDNWKKILG